MLAELLPALSLPCHPALVLPPVPARVGAVAVCLSPMSVPALSLHICPPVHLPTPVPRVFPLCLSPRVCLFPYVSPPVSVRPRPAVSVPPCPSPQPLDGARRTGSERRRRAGGAGCVGVPGCQGGPRGSPGWLSPCPQFSPSFPSKKPVLLLFPSSPSQRARSCLVPCRCLNSLIVLQAQHHSQNPERGRCCPSPGQVICPLGRCAPARLLAPCQPRSPGLALGRGSPRGSLQGFGVCPRARPLPDLESSHREFCQFCEFCESPAAVTACDGSTGGTPSWGDS